ncbi:zinc ribbon domain-containing protein [Methanobrevibacter sp.]|uniref:zinc ribbon domain-containing protein n=1 Tax=Methanobrevibacter sp. TaxID=66852 RepID=UPI0026E0A582|nr:zinc ribbon domain-containing protein [Methanobrevibacter sp.]MDO5860891.1 zinc ribbon domain-containing protein [Methanobrevibacter sp.]
MSIIRHCPNCGNVVSDGDFCTECGYNLSDGINHVENDSKEFFEILHEKTSFPILIFSFVVFGIFLFIGSIVWSSFMANSSIDLVTYFILTIVFSVFFGAIFMGYFACRDKSYVLPNFYMYLGSIFAVVMCVVGLIFTFLMGIVSLLSSILPFGSSSSNYGTSYQPTAPNYGSLIDLSFVFKILLFILLIPVASYFGMYLGHLLRENM